MSWKEIGWMDKQSARRLVIVITDASYHFAGDGLVGFLFSFIVLDLPLLKVHHLVSPCALFMHNNLMGWTNLRPLDAVGANDEGE